MKIKIGLIPAIKETYKNQFSYIVDVKWFSFLRKIYVNPEIILINEKKLPKLNLIIITGGNGSYKIDKKRENFIRENFDKTIIKQAIKKKIPCLGICWGAQSIVLHFNGKLKNSKKHVGNHDIILINNKFGKNLKKIHKVNSYHNQIIYNLKNPLKEIFNSRDGSVEMFKHKSKNIFGIMWHPERYKKISKLDKIIFTKILCN